MRRPVFDSFAPTGHRIQISDRLWAGSIILRVTASEAVNVSFNRQVAGGIRSARQPET